MANEQIIHTPTPVKVFDLSLTRLLCQYESLRAYRRDADNRNKNFSDYRAFQMVPTHLVLIDERITNQ